MTLRLYNTLTRQKDVLEELPGFDRNNVRMYVCGPTVYDFAHIGNARPVIVFDVLYRLLRHLYGPDHVKYVRNITDIDDKINARAAETAAAQGISVEQARAEITAQTAKQYLDDVTALGCLPPNETPRATEYVKPMIAMIERLVAAGHAYAAEGHVLFDVASKPDYGKLARRSLDEMMAGARVEVAPYKKNPMDFVLWKPSDASTPGWDSPWGRGRPGWHIECSAMGDALLGETFDIHGGGIDLMFPHHENEIAQSECAHGGHALARLWMHNGFLQVEGEKMAKSLGNFITINDLLKDWPGEVLRFNMLRTHYREPIDWTVHSLNESTVILNTWRQTYDSLSVSQLLEDHDIFLVEALSDDLNTPKAIHDLHEFHSRVKTETDAARLAANLSFLGVEIDFADLREFRNSISNADFQLVSIAVQKSFEALHDTIVQTEGLREVLAKAANQFLEQVKDSSKYAARGMRWSDLKLVHALQKDGLDVNAAIEARAAARKAKNFKESDRIRDELLSKGIVLKDGPTGTTWEVKR